MYILICVYLYTYAYVIVCARGADFSAALRLSAARACAC